MGCPELSVPLKSIDVWFSHLPVWSTRSWGVIGETRSTAPINILPSFLLNKRVYLESSPQTENAVVGLLGWQALERELDSVVLLGNQIIGSAEERRLAQRKKTDDATGAALQPHARRIGAIDGARTSIPVAGSPRRCRTSWRGA
jgi:hypothetical protein